jgi:hypothetical protein
MGTNAKVSAERLEEIYDDADLCGDSIHLSDNRSRIESIIVETLARLPGDIYSHLMHNDDGRHVWFIGCGSGQYGEAMRRRIWRLPEGVDFVEVDIVLVSNEVCSMPSEAAYAVVAQEIAHVILGHTAENASNEHKESEAAADRLAASWGFEPDTIP